MRNIGDTRTFDTLAGIWEIKKINKKKCIFTLQLHSLKCKNCGTEQYDKRNYTFDYIEELQSGDETKYLGISSCGRYILLDNYIEKEKIKNKMKEVN